ncbi:MAG: flagellar export chaperone FliS [Acidimicrobiia bacterium]|nr:flagellar export chaperone FliS [Acidimicrobiia bacterium]
MYPANARKRFVQDGLSTIPPARLLLMLYERLLRDLDDAAAAIGAGPISAAHEALTHAQAIVDELRLALDPAAWAGAADLAGVYDWVSARLVEANLRKDAALVASCRSVLEPLAEAWGEAYEHQCGAAPVGARSA